MKEYTNLERLQLEIDEDWRECNNLIPFLNFPEGSLIKLTAPFGGALARCELILKNSLHISLYVDFYDRLGYMNKPYIEIYDGTDCHRFLLSETEQLENKLQELSELPNVNN